MDTQELRNVSIEKIKKLGLNHPISLPLIDDKFSFKSIGEIANRINILHLFYAIYLRGKDSYTTFRNIVYEKKYDDYLTGREKKLLDTGKITERDIIDFSWCKESAKTLLWAASAVEEDLMTSFEECDFSLYYPLIPPEKPDSEFIKSLHLREEKLILQHLDFYYCLHWYCKHFSEDLNKAKTTVNSSIVVERRKAFEWITQSVDWDNVFLDT